jgi:tRNA threonylcarbamoyladenosine biosynthesis protein TsaB
MARILSLETSTDVFSVSLFADGNLVKDEIVNQPQAQAEKLAPLIVDILNSASILIQDLNAVAISSGPGSYTGLRIGTSTAKGICFSLNIPLISVQTLDLMAFQASEFNKQDALLCPMIDARRMEVYCKVVDSGLSVVHPVEAKVIDSESFKELLAHHKMLFFGNGAGKCRDLIVHENAIFLNDIFPKASALGILAQKKFDSREFEDLENFKPFYLKEFVAKKGQPLLG